MSDARVLGRWQLHERLGHPGGNADVYRATTANEEVALKVIRAKKADAEPYQRFVREIETLRSLKDLTGILPVVDSYLPERPSKTDQPWLAMPIATTLDVALRDEALEVIVEAVGTVAATLARLHGDGIAHRDVKPANLYRLHDQWLIGDFGLVKTPEPSDLTLPDGKLGPAHFTAYEVIANPRTADPMPADVNALAKTLYVLARNERFPPGGHQPAGTRRFEIADVRPHPNARLLDALIDRATLIHFENRPTMAQVAHDLRGWLALTQQENVIDISDSRAKFRAKVEAALAEEDVAEQRKELAYLAVRRLAELVEPLNRALVDLHPRASIEVTVDQAMGNLTKTRAVFGSPEIVFRQQRQSHIALDQGYQDFSLRFARGLELTTEGDLILHMAMLVGPTRTMGGIRFQWVPDQWSAPVGTVEAENMLRSATYEAGTQLRDAITAFVDAAP